ncbi:hypothetical protein BH09MYX1_BH09MYX1_02820 [soil metagenome]
MKTLQTVRARHAALVLSLIAIVFALGFGVLIRHFIAFPDQAAREAGFLWLIWALSFLLVAYLLRLGASICELIWLERMWQNLPPEMRRVGPVEKVESGMLIGLSFVPVLSWFWKLGLVDALTKGFARVRATIPFAAPIPRRLGIAAIALGWVPVVNVYFAPFVWELFARRIDAVCTEIANAQRVPESMTKPTLSPPLSTPS